MDTKPSKKLQIEERRKLVTVNLMAGHSYRSLAEICEVSVGTIANDVKQILKQLRKEQHENMNDVILLEVARLDRLVNGIWDKAKSGDLQAIDRVLAIQNQRSKFFGLYAPDPSGADAGEIEDIEAVREKRWQQITGNIKDAFEDESGE